MPDKDAGTPRVFLVRHGTSIDIARDEVYQWLKHNGSTTFLTMQIGETEWTMSGRYTGRSDIPLTKNGEQQVFSSAQVIVGPGKIIDPSRIVHLFISPRTRARRTYDLLFDESARAQLEGSAEITEDIREWEYGAYEGLLTAEIRDTRQSRHLDQEKPWNIWESGCEDGESPGEVSTRLDKIINKIREIQGPYMHGEKAVDVVIIGHGHILRAFTKRCKYQVLGG